MRLTIEILPEAIAPLVVETFARAHAWRSEELDGPMGEFAVQAMIDGIYGVLEGKWGEDAAAAARQDAIVEVRQNVTIQAISGNGGR